MPALKSEATTAGEKNWGRREWIEEHKSAIRTAADFEDYPCPTMESLDLSAQEWMEGNIPTGMGC
jgi:hypothetical protein